MELTSLENFFTLFGKQIEELIDKKVQERLRQALSVFPKESNKLFYSLKEVSHITGITFLGLKGRQKRGTLKCVNEGNAVLVPKNELERLLKSLDRQQR